VVELQLQTVISQGKAAVMRRSVKVV
jgi:hypothetical protein